MIVKRTMEEKPDTIEYQKSISWCSQCRCTICGIDSTLNRSLYDDDARLSPNSAIVYPGSCIVLECVFCGLRWKSLRWAIVWMEKTNLVLSIKWNRSHFWPPMFYIFLLSSSTTTNEFSFYQSRYTTECGTQQTHVGQQKTWHSEENPTENSN